MLDRCFKRCKHCFTKLSYQIQKNSLLKDNKNVTASLRFIYIIFLVCCFFRLYFVRNSFVFLALALSLSQTLLALQCSFFFLLLNYRARTRVSPKAERERLEGEPQHKQTDDGGGSRKKKKTRHAQEMRTSNPEPSGAQADRP